MKSDFSLSHIKLETQNLVCYTRVFKLLQGYSYIEGFIHDTNYCNDAGPKKQFVKMGTSLHRGL